MLEIRTSERRSFKRCQQRWEWGYKQQLKPHTDSNPLWFGQAVHLALAEWYKPGLERGVHPAKTFVDVIESDKIKRFSDNPTDEQQAEYADSYKMGVDMLERYVREFGEDTDWECIQPEMTFQVWFPNPVTGQKRWLRYVGTVDAVMRYIGETKDGLIHGSIWLFEHKTAASIQTNHLALDDQAGSYWAIIGIVLKHRGILKQDEEIDGIMYNFLRKAQDDPRPKHPETGKYLNQPQKQHYLDQMGSVAAMYDDFKTLSSKMKVDELEALARKNNFIVYGEESKTQPPPYFLRIPVFRSAGDRRTMLKRIVDEGLHIDAARSERPLLPITKNPTKDCSWDCEFFKMCQLHEAGEDWQAFKEFMFKTWSPYEDHTVKSA